MLPQSPLQELRTLLAEQHPEIPSGTIQPTKNFAHGDFECKAALRLGGAGVQKAQDWAAEPIPGFTARCKGPIINYQALPVTYTHYLTQKPSTPAGKKVVIDYSSPNVAKALHVGHLRSTILGDALARIHQALGDKVMRINHWGDWGTPFGLLLHGIKAGAPMPKNLETLEALYRDLSTKAKTTPELQEGARQELVLLQQGDPANRTMWESLAGISKAAAHATYQELGIGFDLEQGESWYDSMLAPLVTRLEAQGIAKRSQGALIIPFTTPELHDKPMLIQKADGGFLYATTDIAALIHRVEDLKADKIIYVTDSRQALHFAQLFAVASKLGYTTELQHAAFGSILGSNGKPFSSRDGGTVALADLLMEARSRAGTLLEAYETPAEDMESLSKTIGYGALKYADLSQRRHLDYTFEWDRLLSFVGNTAPYLQVAHVRACSILKDKSPGIPVPQETLELELCRALTSTPDVLQEAATTLSPHLVCEHLFQTAKLFHRFYEACPVGSNPSRLGICKATADSLAQGLSLLGIAAPVQLPRRKEPEIEPDLS